MREAKNKWLLEMVNDSNLSLLPGGKNRTDAQAIWKMVTKLKRGTTKWKAWNYKHLQAKTGKLGDTPQGNADIFQSFYEDLFANKVKETVKGTNAAEKWYKQMTKMETDREWRPPLEKEMLTAVKDLKKVAPGLSGIPAEVWKVLVTNPNLKAVKQSC